MFFLELYTEVFVGEMTLYIGFALKYSRGKKEGWKEEEDQHTLITVITGNEHMGFIILFSFFCVFFNFPLRNHFRGAFKSCIKEMIRP